MDIDDPANDQCNSNYACDCSCIQAHGSTFGTDMCINSQAPFCYVHPSCPDSTRVGDNWQKSCANAGDTVALGCEKGAKPRFPPDCTCIES